jgi:hypothetical protein
VISQTTTHTARSGLLLARAGAAGVIVAGVVAVALVLLSVTDPNNPSAAGYLPLAWAAAAVLLAVLVIALFVRRVDVTLAPGFPWLIGVLSFVVSFIPWWGLAGGNPDLGTLIYRGLKVPQGIMQFWDLTLVMQSVDCSRWGFDIYIDNNGCMQDASIYAPGMVWLQYVPFQVFSEANVAFLGVMMIVISSLVLVWLARQSTGLGQILLAIAAIGGPWLLLMERGNIDAVILWAAAAAVLLVRRWDVLWVWALAAALLWLMGTWKYYPFVMGAMLLPVLRLRHGWTVIAGYLVASLGFVLLTWENFRFSSSSNAGMIDYGDFVVLGRVPVVARMLGTEIGAGGLQFGDVLLFALAILAVLWGVGIGLMLRRQQTWLAMLAVGGSALYLASVLLAGFGYGYKAVFLLLAVPLISRFTGHRTRLIAASGVAVLLLVGIQSVVVWNTVMVTTAGLIASGFAIGLGGVTLLRVAWPTSQRPAPASA